MFLDQINRRLAKVRPVPEETELPMEETSEAQPRARKPARRPEDGKTVGVVVPPELRARLEALKERQQLGSIKEALLMAAQTGIERLGL